MRLIFIVILCILAQSIESLSVESLTQWTRGSYASLSYDNKTFTLKYGESTFESVPGLLTDVIAQKQSSGTDGGVGNFDELALTLPDGELAVRYFKGMDAFVFIRRPSNSTANKKNSFPAIWPSFSLENQPANGTRCLGWSAHYFFPGNIETDINKCGSDGKFLSVFQTHHLFLQFHSEPHAADIFPNYDCRAIVCLRDSISRSNHTTSQAKHGSKPPLPFHKQ